MNSHSSTKQFNQGELIFAEGDSVDSFYIIDSRSVSIYVEKCGKEEPICILNQGDYFGEMVFLIRIPAPHLHWHMKTPVSYVSTKNCFYRLLNLILSLRKKLMPFLPPEMKSRT